MTFVRLEYLTPTGWVHGHAGVELLNPGGYVTRLLAKRKFGRATELDAVGEPTGNVWLPPYLPDLSRLVPSDTRIPHLPDPASVLRCNWCESYHREPFDGSCLI